MDFEAERQRMVEILERRGIRDDRVLQAMAAVPRQAFVPDDARERAYSDAPLTIGEGQTISQPYIVALMLQEARLRPTDRVLDVGTGSGYAAAVTAHLTRDVISVERVPALAAAARERLAALGLGHVRILVDDGTEPPGTDDYDAILVAAAAPDLPQTLVDRLRPGGRLVVPVGRNRDEQHLVRVTRTPDGILRETLARVAFVPLIGAYGWPDR